MEEPLLAWAIRILGAAVVLSTLLPLVRRDAWWIRGFEFPRVQLLCAALLVAGAVPVVAQSRGEMWLLLGAIGGSALLQAARILPFTPLWPRRDSELVPRGGRSFGLLVSNVLMTNRDAESFLALVDRLEPDLLLVIEADDEWRQAIESLAARYPHRIEQPQDDTYGMLFYSRFPIVAGEVRFLVEESVPSIHCTVAVPGSGEVRFHGLHPRPPVPHEATETTERDAELLLVAQLARAESGPVIVAGDLNDVAWSYTTGLFRRISGLLDPRIGRGLLATFPAERWWLRFPLDHVFHSVELELVELKVAPAFGSDHLPIFARLQVDDGAGPRRQEPEPVGDDLELVREKIANGVESAE